MPIATPQILWPIILVSGALEILVRFSPARENQRQQFSKNEISTMFPALDD
jgi:hypothetical protein